MSSALVGSVSKARDTRIQAEQARETMEAVEESVWISKELLTAEECDRLVSVAKNTGIMESEAARDPRHRDCLRIEVDDVELADAVWSRLKDHVPQEVWISPEHRGIPGVDQTEEMFGKWVPVGINTHWRIVCYPGRGHFAPHRDADYVVNEHIRSLLTINGYLTALPLGSGGATRFLQDDQPIVTDEKGRFAPEPGTVKYRVDPDRAGKAVVFFHRLMHDGEPLNEGSPPKWLFRTEVMYERDPETAPKLSPDEQEARQIVKQAERAENEGRIEDAIKLYNRAYRLDSTLDGK